jgi:oligopeptide/dipeptide ABC transporter ATP-binding protein
VTALLEIDDLSRDFAMGSALVARLRGRAPAKLRALDHVSLQIESGSSVGIVGESGCGKSTLAKIVLGLLPATSGAVRLDGIELGRHRDRSLRRRVQMVFQDPGSSLNPRLTVGDAIGEVLHVHRLRAGAGIDERCRELLDLVELPAGVAGQRPHALSGGQRQRVAIARALALEPDLLIADEAVAALDVSVQAAVLNLLNDLRERLGLTMLFISHDLGVVRQVTDRVVVLYLGRVVEDQRSHDLFSAPVHPYTRALLAAAPRLGSAKRPGQSPLAGEVPSAIERGPGCAFRPRCPLAEPRCEVEVPLLTGDRPTRRVACHIALRRPSAESAPL